MLQESLPVNNTINIIGKISTELKFSHQIYGEGFYSFTLEAIRLSDTTDMLPVTISDRIIDKSSLQVGTHIKILGQVRSYNNYIESEHKNKLILTIFARDVKIGLSEEDYKQNPNEVILNGYLCKAPIYRVTPFGREIADLLLAVNRSYNKSDYIPCIAWGRNARFAERLSVGENIRVWGRMQSRVYRKKKDNGELEEKTAYEISISKVENMPASDDNGADKTDGE